MKRLLKSPIYILILTGLLISITSKADIWDKPKIRTYYSENKAFKLIITPRMTFEEYHEDSGKSNKHSQTKKKLRKKEKHLKNVSEKEIINTRCTAELYQMKGADSILIWKRPLLNTVCPIHAIVANDGSSIATFDNWYSIGYGVNVLVVYNEKGDARKTYKLEEISPFPLNDYPMSISSLYWRKNARYMGNERIEITFETGDEHTKSRIYNLNNLEFES